MTEPFDSIPVQPPTTGAAAPPPTQEARVTTPPPTQAAPEQTTAGVSDPAAPVLGASVQDSGTERSPPASGKGQQQQDTQKQKELDAHKQKELIQKEERKLRTRQQMLPLKKITPAAATASATPVAKGKDPVVTPPRASAQSPASVSIELVPST